MAILRILTTEVGASEQVLPLGDAPVRLGRAEDNDVVLLEQAASRHHARIEPVDGGYEIIDLGSGGGLTVAGVQAARRRLSDGDELVVGGTRIRFVEHPGSERTLVPASAVPPSSQATELGDDDPGAAETIEAGRIIDGRTDLGDADTMPPSGSPTDVAQLNPGTIQASHQPAPPPAAAAASVPLPQGTIQAPHQPAAAPPPVAKDSAAQTQVSQARVPQVQVQQAQARIETVQPPHQQHPGSNDSFVLGGGPSSPSDYTLDGPGNGASGGYSIEGGGRGFAIDTVPPTSLRRGPGAGIYVLMAFIGAAASFGALIALSGTPW